MHHFRSTNRRGYVLVLTLAVLVLAAGALVSAGRMSVRHAARARQAERDLQRRAGVASCRNAILPHVGQILAAQETQRKSPMPRHRAAVRLGEYTFDLILSDEQSKANINVLLESAEPEVVENRLREALAGTGLAAAIVLRPQVRENRRIVTGLGQMFAAVEPQTLLESRAGRPAPADLLTCWGSGAINVRRASEPSLRLATIPTWTPLDVARLLESRSEMFGEKPGITPLDRTARPAPRPRDPLARLLQNAQIRARPPGLTLQSTCHSLWIIARDGRREWYDLAVEDASGDAPRVMTFSW